MSALLLDDVLTGLPLAAPGTAPEEVTAEALGLVLERLPRKPYCTDDLVSGLRVLPRRIALRRRYIQLDPPGRIGTLVFDVDHGDAGMSWDDAGLPPPSWVAQTAENGHAHVGYVLTWPVYQRPARAPWQYFKAVYRAYRDRLKADPGYARLITKNPWHVDWRVTSWRAEPYSLSELAEYVDLKTPAPPQRRMVDDGSAAEYAARGRNCALFERLRHWAYGAVQDYWRPGGGDAWDDVVLGEAERLAEKDVEHPRGMMTRDEIRLIAHSVSSWTWSHITPDGRADLIRLTHTSERQAERGRRKGGQKRAELLAVAREMRAGGSSVREISAVLGVGLATVHRWLRR